MEKPLPGTLRYAVQVLAKLSDYDFAAVIRRGKVALAAKVIGHKSRDLIRLAREARAVACGSGLSCPYCRNEE